MVRGFRPPYTTTGTSVAPHRSRSRRWKTLVATLVCGSGRRTAMGSVPTPNVGRLTRAGPTGESLARRAGATSRGPGWLRATGCAKLDRPLAAAQVGPSEVLERRGEPGIAKMTATLRATPR